MAKKSTAKSKTKSQSKISSLQSYRNIAQYVTISSAMLFGIIWAFQELVPSDVTSFNAISNLLISATMIGGVIMGLLYIASKAKK